MGKISSSMMIKLMLVLCFLCVEVLCKSKKPSHGSEFDFFYFVQQWPGAYCDTKGHKCCYPNTGKPTTDFHIHGLWPNYNDGGYPSNCDSSKPFDVSELDDDFLSKLTAEWPSFTCPNIGTKFWAHEWNKHGTCAESIFTNERDYFQAALDLKQKTNLLQALNNANIKPNDEFYNVEDVKEAMKNEIGFYPWIECNRDAEGNSQIYQVYVCVDSNGKDLIECPVLPHGNCASRVQFPKF
ncbi:hypothetical protein RND81_11G041200 [Saponaria officinalis]|uniref:Uncharacterized protein n=1 Tax=Saponaria officinalis TaxID=3572 RepID=A0AAW1HHJ3_SAPOF